MNNLSQLILLVTVQASMVVYGTTLSVPDDFSTVKAAVNASDDGDIILISDGSYVEDNITIDKSLTIASAYLIDGDESHVSATVIDGDNNADVLVTDAGSHVVTFIGLTVTGGEKLIVGNSEIYVDHCRFLDGSDQVSFEDLGFGRVSNSKFVDASDDAIDVDSAPDGGNPFIEIVGNHITNCGDDGIEIRLFRRSGPIMPYTIENNTILNVDEDGIQLIDARASANDNSRIFYISHNLIVDSDAVGIGCMPDQDTIEDFGGAPGMDEPVYIVNNTIVENRYGVTGGDNTVVLNCIIKDNSSRGVNRVKNQGIVDYTLFHNNGTDISDSIEGSNNYFDVNPQYDSNNYQLLAGSFSIDKGIAFYTHNGAVILDLSPGTFSGNAPDLGAFEFGSGSGSGGTNKAPQVDAGVDRVILEPEDSIFIDGIVSDDGLPNGSLLTMWSKISGPGNVTFSPENSERTTANFSLMGIYELRLMADDGELTASDTTTMRYVKGGSGINYAIDGDVFIEAEEYSYLYGTAEVINEVDSNGGNAVQALEGMGTHAFADYTIVTTDALADLNVWIRMKGPDSGGNSLYVEFNGSETTTDVETVVGDNIYKWNQLDGSFTTEAGAWRLRVKANEDGVFWDTIAISTDPDFDPNTNETNVFQSDGPVGYWDMDEGAGSTAFDRSGNENHANLSGAKFTSPKYGSFALRFDGFNDYAEVISSPILNEATTITVAAWIRPDDLTNGLDYPSVITKKGAYRIYTHTDRRVRFQVTDSMGDKITAISDSAIPDQVWTHIAGIFDGSSAKIFVHGILESVVPVTNSGGVSENGLFIGAGDPTRYFFDGRVDDLRIYSRAINEEEIFGLSRGASLSVTPLTGSKPVLATANVLNLEDQGNQEFTYLFDFGDGTFVGPKTEPTAIHAYPDAGTYVLSVVVMPSADPPFTIFRDIHITDDNANLVGNPSFETDTSGWVPYQDGATLDRVPDGCDGAFSVEITGDPSSAATFGLNDSPDWVISTLAAGMVYRFTAKIKSNTNSGRSFLRIREYLDGVKVGPTTESNAVILLPTWQTVTIDRVSEAAGSALDLQILNDPLVSGEVFQVDAVSIRVIQ